MLQINNLNSPFFENLNLSINSGEIVAIIGSNGSGKSTLAKMIAGYYTYESGEINNFGSSVALLTQNPFLQFIGIDVFDEVTYSLEQKRSSPEVIAKAIANCDFRLEQKLSTLSGGEAQRLLIYKELIGDSEIIILDETLSNLDNVNKKKIIASLKETGKTVILITNNLDDTRFASKVYKLIDKQLVTYDHKPAQLKLLANKNDIAITYDDYQFKYGINLITGESSSGKSTLITNMCFDLKTGISLIPQYPFEIITTAYPKHLKESKWLSQVGLDNAKLEQNITELSTGELVKVLLVEALESSNEILVLDESIEVLDNLTQTKVLDIITAEFKTVIIITHNPLLFTNRSVNVLEVK